MIISDFLNLEHQLSVHPEQVAVARLVHLRDRRSDIGDTADAEIERPARGRDFVHLVGSGNHVAGKLCRRAKRQLVDVNAKILGVVLNDLDFTEGGYYYNYYHYYYYRRYAYGSDPKNEAKA